MARVSRRTKRRTNRKKNRSIKRSIKRDLEKSLRKTIERSIKKSLNKFNKRIKKYKKKKTKKKKIQRGGSAGAAAGVGTGQSPGQPRGAGGLRSADATPGDPNAVTGPIIESLHNQYDSMSGNLDKIIEGCHKGEEQLIEVPGELDAVQKVIKTTYRRVLDKLKQVTGKSEDKEAISEYFITGYSQNKGIAKQVYKEEEGFNIFICDLYLRYRLFEEDNLRIQREIDGARAAAEAAAAAAERATDDAAREAANKKEREDQKLQEIKRQKEIKDKELIERGYDQSAIRAWRSMFGEEN